MKSIKLLSVLDMTDLATLTHTSAVSLLEHGNMFYMVLPLMTQKVQIMQNVNAQFSMRANHSNYSTHSEAAVLLDLVQVAGS